MVDQPVVQSPCDLCGGAYFAEFKGTRLCQGCWNVETQRMGLRDRDMELPEWRAKWERAKRERDERVRNRNKQ